ncbi:MAG: hypothetical protein HC856_09090 [Pseudanabaena sp. RU_4_16]|nr:hypothetical protein [Pseudanabaena sp. SU_2_4]NJM28315.1 hypothetical protein [Pseudanabaena sp. RU_4_16]NKB17227.1 hypothetical protein [Pseudanabaena sp. CRU_2_10]
MLNGEIVSSFLSRKRSQDQAHIQSGSAIALSVVDGKIVLTPDNRK